MHVMRTGLQGNGKTLNTIKEVDTKAAKESRVVYYNNIRDFKPDHPAIKADWRHFDDPLQWHKLPPNAIIVIDEAQQFFRVRRQGSPVPEYASALETMRHQGHELHCITQAPSAMDTHFRKLCNSHIHYTRGHGGKIIKRWQFERVNLDVEKREDFSNGESSRIFIDSTYFGCYKSVAEGAEHHFKFRPPKAMFVLAACAVLLCLAAWKIYSDRIAAPQEAAAKETALPAAVAPAGSVPAVGESPMTREQYIQAYTPRVPDVPSSAPIYDQLTQPVTFPKPFCVATFNQELLDRNARRFTVGVHRGKFGGCFCNSQQGTKIDMSFRACMDIVENGYFDNTKPDRPSVAQGDSALEPDGGAGRAGAESTAATAERTGPRLTIVADSSRDGRPLTPVSP